MPLVASDACAYASLAALSLCGSLVTLRQQTADKLREILMFIKIKQIENKICLEHTLKCRYVIARAALLDSRERNGIFHTIVAI